MNYQELVLYLKKTLKIPSLDFIWSEEKNKTFFDYIKENFPKDYLQKRENLLEIKRAFTDFFEPVGYILFRLKGKNISVKVFPYSVQAQDSKYVENLVQLIEDNEQHVEFNYKGKKDQIVIDSVLQKKLYHFVTSIKDEKVNKKELIKYAIREVLELENEDLVLNKKTKIFIKLFKFTKRKEVQAETETKANRYNGYTKKELQELYNEYFDKNSIGAFLKMMAKSVFEELFLEKQISNIQYEKNIYALVQLRIAEELVEFTDENMEFRKGFAGFMFRMNFLHFFNYLSEELLKEIANRNEYMLKWLKYYDGKVFVDEGEKYRSPELITPDEQRWNPAIVYSKVAVWFKTKDKIKLFQEKIIKIEESMQSLEVDGKSPLDYKESLFTKKKEKEEFIHKMNIEILNLIEEKHMLKDLEDKKEMTKKIFLLREELKEHHEEIRLIEEQIADVRTEGQYKKLSEEKFALTRDIKREKKNLEQNAKAYHSIKAAVTRAMTSKRIAV